MKQIIRPTGIGVEIPSAYDITDVAPGFRRGGSAFAGTRPEPGVITDVLIEALREHELVLMDEIPVTPSATPAPDRGVRRRGAAEEKMSSRITVPLAEEDEAIVLLEQDGAYSWVFPQDQPDGGRRRSSVAAGVGKSRTFEINLAGQGRPARRSTIIGEFLLGRARALVFRFVARVVADGAMAFLERNVKSGLVTMRGDPLEWHPKPPAALEATRTRTLHILLFIHGTFSSTRGSFGALGLTEGGKALLERAAAKYDQVIGFDHPTLSVDPRHNADDLVAALEQISGGHPLHIDVVSYSRGGLVYRALAQRLAARREISFGRVCFIAVPNAGTTLAEFEKLAPACRPLYQRGNGWAETSPVLARRRFRLVSCQGDY